MASVFSRAVRRCLPRVPDSRQVGDGISAKGHLTWCADTHLLENKERSSKIQLGERGNTMGFYEVLDQVVALLPERGRVTFRGL